jgi:hypothetical protein
MEFIVADIDEGVKDTGGWRRLLSAAVAEAKAAGVMGGTIASRLLSALKAILPYAENEHASLFECWKRDGEAAAEAEAEACGRAIDQATTAIAAAEAAGATTEPDIHALLAARRQIAAIWSIEDVQEIHPGLTDGQAWEVLEAVGRYHDATIGINWDVLGCHADMLFGDAPETDEAAEA